MSNSLRLGIAGLGTVGTGVLDILRTHGPLVDMRSGRGVVVTGVSARSKGKDRGHDLSKLEWQDDPVALARSAGIDVFIELIGGDSGPAKDAVEAALKAGKHVITANKALLAHHGVALAKLAESAGVSLNYEAAVAGGIPVIKTLREGSGGQCAAQGVRHSERHLQLHSDEDGRRGPLLRRRAERGAGLGLRRSRPDLRRRRL